MLCDKNSPTISGSILPNTAVSSILNSNVDQCPHMVEVITLSTLTSFGTDLASFKKKTYLAHIKFPVFMNLEDWIPYNVTLVT